ncbi:hypothetical protein ACWPKS_04735 [Coraliomargarita sp. W4R72]
MNKSIIHTLALISTSVLLGSYAQGAATVYNGSDNDWNNASNWDAGVPGSGDNARFTSVGMVLNQNITQSVSTVYVGLNNASTLEIAAGGVLTNSSQTLVGFGASGAGTLNITGGTLNTGKLLVAETGGEASSFVTISSGVLNITGIVHVGTESASTFTVSGGTVSTTSYFHLRNGSTLNIIGADGSLNIGGAFNFANGTGGLSSTVSFSTDATGAVSTIFADSFAYFGTNSVLSIDGSAGTIAGSLTLMSLANDTFSSGELSSLQSALSLNNISGSLSLANGDKDLIFTAIPEASTYALLAGMVTFSFLVIRRRR